MTHAGIVEALLGYREPPSAIDGILLLIMIGRTREARDRENSLSRRKLAARNRRNRAYKRSSEMRECEINHLVIAVSALHDVSRDLHAADVLGQPYFNKQMRPVDLARILDGLVVVC